MQFAEGIPNAAQTRRAFLARLAAVAAVPALARCDADSDTPVIDTPGGSDSPGPSRGLPLLPTAEPLMRVRVLRTDGPSAQVLIGRASQWLALESASTEGTGIVLRGPVVVRVGGERWSVTDAGGVQAGVEAFEPLELVALSEAEPELTVQQRAYPGRLRLLIRGDMGDRGFDVVNIIAMEAYLPGVVAGELFSHWLAQTRAAQAVAARSFAASEHEWFRDRRGWDVTGTAHSQVYQGRIDHRETLDAVEATRGVMLGFHGNLVAGYYSSCCGGTAACAVDAIGDNPVNSLPPLAGRSGQDVCTGAAVARWTIDRLVPRLTRRLAAWGRDRDRPLMADGAEVAAIDVLRRNEHGRPTRYAVTDTLGHRVVLSAEDLRNAVNFSGDGLDGPRQPVLSSHLSVSIRDGTATFAGRGFGHGVGMCQYGAETMARAGAEYPEILPWFYPGVELVKAY